MACITSVSYQVLFNGTMTESFTLGRGIYQSDPLSPYLFIICLDLLIRNFMYCCSNKLMPPLRASRFGPQVLMLAFADDCILFFKTDRKSCEPIEKLLQNFEQASGQKLNRNKSSLYFSPNTPRQDQRMVRRLFGVQKAKEKDRYLGSFIQEKLKNSDFFFLVDKTKTRMMIGIQNLCHRLKGFVWRNITWNQLLMTSCPLSSFPVSTLKN
ncbi:hypothetical protein ACH5RR_024930 [Cinchona calisaya]|uniref:Reverse transcriptase domain-containing protein n=1 Tax=Cinchona calisaya TaxID=153742 RepID=A0ABD2YZ92_9GENT